MKKLALLSSILFLSANMAFAQYSTGTVYTTVDYANNDVLIYAQNNLLLPYSSTTYNYDVDDLSSDIFVGLDPENCGLTLQGNNYYHDGDQYDFTYYTDGSTTTSEGGFNHTFLLANVSVLQNCLQASNTPIVNFGDPLEEYTGYHWSLFGWSTSTSAMTGLALTMINNPEQLDLNYEISLSYDSENTDNNSLILWLSDRTGDYTHKEDGYNDPYFIQLYLQPNNSFAFSEYTPPPPPVESCNPFTNDISTLFINYDFSLSDCLLGLIDSLFTPSTASVSQFTDLKETIENKPPFGYFTIISASLDGITASSSTSTVDIVIPEYLDTYIFTPFKIALGALLWFVALVWLYNRLKQIQL